MYKEGLITVDLQMMIQPYLFMFLMGIGREFGVTPVLFDKSKPEEMSMFDDLVNQNILIKNMSMVLSLI